MREHTRARAAGGLLALALVLATAGCESDTAEEDDGLAADAAARGLPEGFHDVSDLFPVRVRADVTGAVTFVYDGEEDVHVTHAGGPGMQTNVFSMGFTVPVRLEDPAERFRWGFDLLHAYAGPGRYEFDEDAGQGFRNIVQLVYLRAKDPTAEALYDPDEAEEFLTFTQIRQPCVLETSEPDYTGTLTCPELADEDGQTVRMTVTWEHRDQL